MNQRLLDTMWVLRDSRGKMIAAFSPEVAMRTFISATAMVHPYESPRGEPERRHYQFVKDWFLNTDGFTLFLWKGYILVAPKGV